MAEQAAEQRLRLQSMNLPGLRLARLSYDAQVAALEQWARPVRRFAAARDARELRMLRMRIEDRSPIAAFRWHGMPGEDAALARLQGCRGGGGARRSVGVRSEEGPRDIVMRADFLAGGVEGFARVLEALPRMLEVLLRAVR